MGRKEARGATASRLWFSLMALVLVLGSACGGSSSSSSNSGPLPANTDIGLGSPSPTLCHGRKFVIGYDSFSDSEAFAHAVKLSTEAAAQKVGCVTLKELVDNVDPATIIQNAQTFITEHVDGVISFNVLDGPNGAIINMYTDAHIPIVAIALYAVGVTFISDNDRASGAQAGSTAAMAFKAKFPGATPTAIIGEAPQAGLVNLNREGGIEDGIKSVFPNATIIKVDGKGAQEPSATGTANTLQGIPAGTKLIVSGINENTVYGMYTALQRTNRVQDAIVVGIGGDNVGFNGLCKLGYAGDIAYFPETWGSYDIPAVLGRVNNLSVPPAVLIPSKVLTKDNLAQYYPSQAC